MNTSPKVQNSSESEEEQFFTNRPVMLLIQESFLTYSQGPCEQEFTKSQLIFLKDKIEETLNAYERLGITDEMINAGNTQALDDIFSEARKSNNPKREKKKPREGHIYLIQNTVNKALKVGFSKNPNSRLQQLNTASPDPLEMICYMKGTLEDEQEIHRKLSGLKLNTEWYPESQEVYKHF